MKYSPYLKKKVEQRFVKEGKVYIKFYEKDPNNDMGPKIPWSYVGTCNTCGVTILTNAYYWLKSERCFCSDHCFEARPQPYKLGDIFVDKRHPDRQAIYVYSSRNAAYGFWGKEKGCCDPEGIRIEDYKEHMKAIRKDLCSEDTAWKRLTYLWVTTDRTELIQKGGEDLQNIYRVLVIDKTKDEIIVDETIIDGDERSVVGKVSIKWAEKLKDIIFDTLEYIVVKLGSYETKKKGD